MRVHKRPRSRTGSVASIRPWNPQHLKSSSLQIGAEHGAGHDDAVAGADAGCGGALPTIYIENGVWSADAKGFSCTAARRGDSVPSIFASNTILCTTTRYRSKLEMPSNVLPGGLFDFDPATSELRRFTPNPSKLRGGYIFMPLPSMTPFGSQARRIFSVSTDRTERGSSNACCFTVVFTFRSTS
jgi:hypothetical protein